jgi:hypothetical protein
MIQSLDTGSDDLVYVDFPEFTRLNNVEFHLNSKKMKITNLHSAHPECDIDGTKFIGRYEVNLGSQVFFEHQAVQNDEKVLESKGGDDDGRVQYHGMTVKVLNFYLVGIDAQSEKKRVANKLESMREKAKSSAKKRSYAQSSVKEDRGDGDELEAAVEGGKNAPDDKELDCVVSEGKGARYEEEESEEDEEEEDDEDFASQKRKKKKRR